jgi:hypothetical protein
MVMARPVLMASLVRVDIGIIDFSLILLLGDRVLNRKVQEPGFKAPNFNSQITNKFQIRILNNQIITRWQLYIPTFEFWSLPSF